jgi:hypothetical protein
VVYIAAEAGASIARRFVAWRDRNLGDAREGRTPLAIVTRGANLLDAMDAEALIAALRDIEKDFGMPPALVVFDTLSRSIPGGDENRAEDMTKVIEMADRIRGEFGAATLAVHHSGKDSQRGARGHSSLFAAADAVISVTDKVATIEKSRDGVSGERFPFELDVIDLGVDQDGDPVTTCVVRHTIDTPARRPLPKLSPGASTALRALREVVEERGELMPATSTIPKGAHVVTIECWRARFKLRYGQDEGGRSKVSMAFTRARQHLAGVNAIGVSDPYVWVLR